MTEDEMVGWHHRFNGCEPGQTPGDGEGQRSQAYRSPRVCEEQDATWRLNKNSKGLTLERAYCISGHRSATGYHEKWRQSKDPKGELLRIQG